MATSATFDTKSIDQTLEAARQKAQQRLTQAPATHQTPLADEHLTFAAGECLTLKVENNEICLDLPFGLGKHCLPIPGWVPNGATVQACLNICTVLGVPCGVEVTVSVQGRVIVRKGFGCC